VDEPVADHLVLPLEALAAFGPAAGGHVAVVRPDLRVHVGVGAASAVSARRAGRGNGREHKGRRT
jgi:hypothetical protein